MGLNDLRGDDIAAASTELSESLPLSRPQIHSAFDPEQQQALKSMLAEVRNATNHNDKVAALQKHAAMALTLLGKLGVAV